MAPQRRGAPGNNMGILMLFAQIMNFGVQNIPPVTLALLAGQIGIFMNVFPSSLFPSIERVCMSSYFVYFQRDYLRMLLSSFYHAHDMHLYFNMISFLNKGSSLERRFGSRYFAYLIGVFTALTSATYVGLGLGLTALFNDHSYLTSCAVGFSGVIFALKVLTTYYSTGGITYVMGVIPFPYRYVYWLELVLIQLVTPNASFVGHLAGILVGVAYCFGPLKMLMDSFLPPGEGLSRQSSFDGRTPDMQQTPQARSPFGSGLFRRADRGGLPAFTDSNDRLPGNNEQERNYNNYTGGLSEDEQYRSAMEESQRMNGGSYYDRDMSEEEQYRRAVEESRRSQGGGAGRLYPDLDDLRSKRRNFYK